jgi:hypothetical protein
LGVEFHAHRSGSAKVLRSKERRAKECSRIIVSEGDGRGEDMRGQSEVSSAYKGGGIGFDGPLVIKMTATSSGLKQIIEE